MIPTSQNNINDFTFQELPSKTYKINQLKDEQRIYGNIDGIEALKQAIYLMLSVERYENIIYSWNYGIELSNLFGKDKYYVMAELERVITEALLIDDRINEVTDFEFDTNKNKVHCTFTVKSIYGDFTEEKTIEV